MDLKLVRFMWRESGIYSRLLTIDNQQVAVTLEHAYYEATGGWKAKIPDGTYTCKRWQSIKFNKELFIITNVPEHDSIEFHIGNKNADSDGCVLLGQALEEDSITHSDDTFKKFMALQAGVESFQLEVS